MNAERAKRREKIAARLLAGMCATPESGTWESCVSACVTGAEILMVKLDEAEANDPVCSNPESESVTDLKRKLASNVRRRGELMDSCLLKDAELDDLRLENTSLNQTVATLDKQIGELNSELSRLRQFVDGVRAEAHEDPELYGPFIRLVRDLEPFDPVHAKELEGLDDYPPVSPLD